MNARDEWTFGKVPLFNKMAILSKNVNTLLPKKYTSNKIKLYNTLAWASVCAFDAIFGNFSGVY